MNWQTELVEQRKMHGYSQEELAERLGVSRQAVSKWERAESSPDTYNLIALAKLYNISLDELIGHVPDLKENGKSNEKNIDDEKEPKDDESAGHNEEVSIGNGAINIVDGDETVSISTRGIYIKDGKDTVSIGKNGRIDYTGKNGENDNRFKGYVHKRSGISWSDAPIAILVTIMFFIMGLVWGLWHPGWIVFMLIPILHGLIEAVQNKNLNNFPYPVLIAAIYLFVGCMWGYWHITWIMFLTIPLYYWLANQLRK